MSTTEEAESVEVASDPVRDAIAQAFSDQLGDGYIEHHVVPGRDLTIRVSVSSWVDAARFARDQLGMTWLDFVSAIDWLPTPFGRDMDAEQDWALRGRDEQEPEDMSAGLAGGDTRIQAFMRLYSTDEHTGVTIKCDLADDAPALDTIIPIYAGAAWHERELAEMFGIDVVGHPDLRALYLPSDFEGNPLRKDYPLVARRVKPWPGIVDVEAMPDDGQDNSEESAADTDEGTDS